MHSKLIDLFVHYDRTGKILRKFTEDEQGYIVHCLKKCGGTTDGHPLFVLMTLNGDGSKIENFLILSKRRVPVRVKISDQR